MNSQQRDELLVRVDEKVHGMEQAIDRLCKAVVGLYGVWAAIIVTVIGTAIVAAVRGR